MSVSIAYHLFWCFVLCEITCLYVTQRKGVYAKICSENDWVPAPKQSCWMHWIY